MTQSSRFGARPQLPDSKGPPQLAVQAQPGIYGTSPPAFDPDAAGLINGLASFNPALNGIVAMAGQANREQDARARREAGIAGRAAAEQNTDPVAALTGQPVDVPSTVPQAYGNEFRNAWSETIGHRAGVENKLDAMTEYGRLQNTPDFQAAPWLAEKRAAALQGITDPRMVATVGAHFDELQAEIRSEEERKRRIKQDEARYSTASTLASDMFTSDMNVDKIKEAFPLYQSRMKDIGFDNKQSAAFMFGQMQQQSAKLGGAPELFDVFDQKTDNGQRLIDMNPELAPHIIEAKQRAVQMRDKALKEGAEVSNGKWLDALHADIDTNPFAVTEDRVLAQFTKYGAVQSAPQYASLMHAAREAQMKFTANQQLMGMFDKGELWRLEPGQQNKIMDARLGGAIELLAQANRSGDAGAVAQVGSLVMQAHSASGATVAFDQLKNYVSTLTTNLQSKDGPSPAFNSAVELYKSMSGNAQYRDLYFNDEVSKVLKGYIGATNNGTDAKAAYTQAYQSVSPEAKAAAEAFTKTPDFQKMVAADAKKYVEGSSWWPRMLGGNGRPENQSVVGAAIAGEMREWRSRNPFATDSDAQEYAQSWTSKNFVLDSSTGSAIKVPPGMSGPAAQEAFTEHSKEVAKQLNLGARNDANWRVQYIPTGSEGTYNVVAFNGAASKNVGAVNVTDLETVQRAKKTLSDDERASLGAMREGLKNGSPVPIDPALLAKAQAVGALKSSEVEFYKDQANSQFLERLRSIPQMSFGTPSFDNLQFIPSKPNVKIDNALTAKTAQDFIASFRQNATGAGAALNGGVMSGRPSTDHTGLAASLITMGEAVSLKAYDDPASGAGKNIGMGYNLNANKATSTDDLKRAGVDPSVIPMVLDGKAELTPDQAKRLLLVSLPRYEKQVKEVAEDTSPGLWNKMLPQQRAVMLDVAWQVGSTDKYKKAWAALAAGDQKAFADETKVFYTDRSGERKEDTRRSNLRASMLSGLSHWDETVAKFGSLPSTKLQAVAFNNQ